MKSDGKHMKPRPQARIRAVDTHQQWVRPCAGVLLQAGQPMDEILLGVQDLVQPGEGLWHPTACKPEPGGESAVSMPAPLKGRS